ALRRSQHRAEKRTFNYLLALQNLNFSFLFSSVRDDLEVCGSPALPVPHSRTVPVPRHHTAQKSCSCKHRQMSLLLHPSRRQFRTELSYLSTGSTTTRG